MLDKIIFIYRDPLFGITILVAIILVLVIADYGRNQYRLKKRQMDLKNFSESYGDGSLSDEIMEFFMLAKKPVATLLFLADTYHRAGDSASAIKIHLAILQKVNNISEKIIILESLGITYFKAGFLQRAKTIFLEVLKNHPYNYQILMYLIQTYENMGQYQEALDTLECLDEVSTKKQQDKNTITRTYLSFMVLSGENFLSLKKKTKEITALMRHSKCIDRLGLGYLYTYDRAYFWRELLEFKNVEFCFDILWQLKKDEIPLESIQNHSAIMDVYRAKGYVKDDVECEIFELETLRILHKNAKIKGDLLFEYRCHNCKNIFPFDNYRCAVCSNVGEMDLIYKIKEKKENRI